MQSILDKLQLIKDNPGFYKGLTPEEQAELFLSLLTPAEKPKEPKIIKGIDGKTPVKDVDYLSKERAEAVLSEIRDNVNKTLSNIKVENGKDGKDAEITPDLIEQIVTEAANRIPVATVINQEPEAIRNALELLLEDQRISRTAIDGLDDYEEIAQLAREPKVIYQGGTIGKTQVYAFIKQAIADGTISTSGLAESFETVSKNLDASNATLNYTGDTLTSIVYNNGITKTLNYTGDNLTSVVLSGATPNGITLTKTLAYTGTNLTGVTYT